MRRNSAIAAAVVIVAVLGGVVAINQNIVGLGQSPQPTTLVLSGYELDGSPSSAAAYVGNEVVVLGTIDRYEPARWNTKDQNSTMRSIFTPVQVKVETVL